VAWLAPSTTLCDAETPIWLSVDAPPTLLVMDVCGRLHRWQGLRDLRRSTAATILLLLVNIRF
jgi:hypothetical protein